MIVPTLESRERPMVYPKYTDLHYTAAISLSQAHASCVGENSLPTSTIHALTSVQA